MAFAYCLACAKRICLGKTSWVGQAVFCERCGADLEVTRLNPLELDWTENLVHEDQDQLRDLESVPA
jgi:lysine biosynthesis protein LysW